jgi:hypothetical protein
MTLGGVVKLRRSHGLLQGGRSLSPHRRVQIPVMNLTLSRIQKSEQSYHRFEGVDASHPRCDPPL